MNPIIFDLDDTLYPELTFVDGGFRAVARHLNHLKGISELDCYSKMKTSLGEFGRGSVFDNILKSYGFYTRKNVRDCIQVYRNHRPDLKLYDAASVQLDRLLKKDVFLVTDGNKLVQDSKVRALGLTEKMSRVYITHRFGLVNAKPSTYCFSLIKNICQCNWSDMTYIGDNPLKDFVNLKKLGVFTIRVKTGYFSHYHVPEEYDADISIDDLYQLDMALQQRYLYREKRHV